MTLGGEIERPCPPVPDSASRGVGLRLPVAPAFGTSTARPCRSLIGTTEQRAPTNTYGSAAQLVRREEGRKGACSSSCWFCAIIGGTSSTGRTGPSAPSARPSRRPRARSRWRACRGRSTSSATTTASRRSTPPPARTCSWRGATSRAQDRFYRMDVRRH
ncbi:hypothetical protein LV779_16815 [Streptomyces thinghirensis]|nr:hypothetical protein [Streptomyces thinghirensis]